MLPSLCVAFLIGLIGGSFLAYFPLTLVSLLGLTAVGLALGERTRRISPTVGLAWYGVVCAGVVYWQLVTPPPKLDEPQPSRAPMEYVGRIVAPVQHAPNRMILLLRLQNDLVHQGRPTHLRLTWREPDRELYEGERVAFQAKLRTPSGSRNPRGFDYEVYLEHQGIDLVATVSGNGAIQIIDVPGSNEWRWRLWESVDRWRGLIREAAIRSVSQPALGLFLGIVIGERGYLDDDLREWFMTTGTVHLLSISGSHLGLIALVLFGGIRAVLKFTPADWLLALSRRITPTRLAIIGTALGTTFYTLLAGVEIATVRAWIMIVLGLAAVWRGSERRLRFALAGAAFLIVLHEPRAVFDISFQLSFLSVLAMLWIVETVARQDESSDPSQTSVRCYVRGIGEAGAAGAVVMLVTAPVVAWYFNQIPWLGTATNLLAVPFTGFLLVPLGVCTGLISLVSGTDSLPGAALQTRFMEWMIDGLRWCASLPGADWRVAAPPLAALVLFYVGLFAMSGQSVTSLRRLGGAGVVFVAIGWWWASVPFVDHDRWRVTFLDVGQGDSAVLELPDGQTILIDGGAKYERFDMGRGVVAPFLLNHGLRRIDHIIATHPQQDHVGGLIWLIRHLDIGAYWHLGIERKEPLFEDLRRSVEQKHVPVYLATRGQAIARGTCRLVILSPAAPAVSSPSDHSPGGMQLNNQSIATQLICGSHSLVFAADLEIDGLRQLELAAQIPTAVLKVPHHGAKSSLDREWIARVRPRYAVLSAGRYNSYGHPTPEVIAAYTSVGSTIERTDRDGAVTVTGRLSSPDIRVQTVRDLVLHPVDPHQSIWDAERANWHRLWQLTLDS